MPGLLVNEWLLPDGGFVVISDAVCQLVTSYRQIAAASAEAGGILLGYRRDPHLEILVATEPGDRDIRRRRYFERCDPIHQRAAQSAWEVDPYIHYIGEWHTHPESLPAPSSLDLGEWKILGRKHLADSLIMLIIGQDGCWAGVQRKNSCEKLNTLVKPN